MIDNIFRFLYVVLGIWCGFEGYMIFNPKGGLGLFLIFVVFGICISLSIKEDYLDTTIKEILGLVIGIFLSFPISYCLQYLLAFYMLLFKIAKRLLGFPVIRNLALLLLLVIVIAIVYHIVKVIKRKIRKKKK